MKLSPGMIIVKKKVKTFIEKRLLEFHAQRRSSD